MVVEVREAAWRAGECEETCLAVLLGLSLGTYGFSRVRGAHVFVGSEERGVISLRIVLGWARTDEQERQQLVIEKCTAAAPHHGPVWQSVAKDLANIGKSTSEILALVADKLEK